MPAPFTPADYLDTILELEREYGIEQCYSDYKLSIELPEILTDPDYYRQFVESSVTTYCALLNSTDGDNQ